MVFDSVFSSAASTQFVGELGGQRVRDTEAGYRSLGAERDQEMGLAGAGVPDPAQRLALLDPLALGQGVDDRGIDAGWALKSKPRRDFSRGTWRP